VKSRIAKSMFEKNYPFLATSDNGLVVLFSAPTCGTVVYNPRMNQGDEEVGSYSTEWSMSVFRPCMDEITLSN
jgi:hypothetical protein